MITAAEIKRRLADRAEEVCRHLLPHGKRDGRQWKCGDIYGSAGDSTIVELDGTKAGVWGDFANLDTASGDLLDLWQAVRKIGFREAFIEAKKFLNVTDPQSVVPSKRYSPPRPPKAVIRLKEVPDHAVQRYLTEERKLSPATIIKFKIAAIENRQKDSGIEVVFPSYSAEQDLTAVKYVNLKRSPDGKKITSAEAGCAPVMFGWQAFNKSSRVVLICEGEIDCCTWHEWGVEMALSVPGGAANMNWIDYEWENFEAFETIYLAFDMDEAGDKACAIAAQRLGLHRCKIVKLPHKDANECLQKGMTAEDAARCLMASKHIAPIDIKTAADFRDQVHKLCDPNSDGEDSVGLKTKLFGPRFRIRPGEITLWSGHTSHGKSTLLSQIMIEAMLAGQRVAIGSFEVKGAIQLKKMLHCIALEKYLKPEMIDAGINWLSDRLYIYDIVGIVKRPHLGELMAYSVQRHGVSHIVIDSLMKCDIGTEDYEAQKQFTNELTEFSHRYNVHIHLVAHPRKDKSDENPPGIYDVSGGQAIVGQPDNMVVVWRNKRKEKDKESGVAKDYNDGKDPDTITYVNKQRLTGEEFKVWMWMHQAWNRFTSRHNEFEDFGIIAKTPQNETNP